MMFGGTSVQYLNLKISNHCPLLVCVTDSSSGRGRPFRFFRHLAEHRKFDEIVQRVWHEHNVSSMKGI